MKPPLTPDRQGAALLALCAAFLIVVMGLAAVVESIQGRAEKLYEQGRPEATQLVVLLDVTDPPTPDQAMALEDRLSHAIERTLRPGDRLTVWVLGQSPEGPLYRVARMTLPPRDSNPLFQNPRRTREHYEARITHPLHRILAELPATRPSTASPILEAIDALAELPDLRGKGERHLLIASDLAQHSPAVTFLTQQPSFEVFARSRADSRPERILHGVAVEVLVFSRSRQSLELELARRRFWQAYLSACGAPSVEVERL